MEKEVMYEFENKDAKMTQYEDGSIKLEGAKVVIKQPSQLDIIEKKMDRILELLEGKELSTSVSIDSKKIAETIHPYLTRQQRVR